MKNLQIKHKLVIIIMSTVIFSLLLVSSVLILSERYIAKQSMTDKLMTVSHIIADGSTAALSFDDQQVANEVLSALDHEPRLSRAASMTARNNCLPHTPGTATANVRSSHRPMVIDSRIKTLSCSSRYVWKVKSSAPFISAPLSSHSTSACCNLYCWHYRWSLSPAWSLIL